MNHGVSIRRQKGFTLIELMLAMSFISVLLLAVAMTIIQIGTIYNKGLALKELNQASRDVATDVRKALSAADGIDTSKDYVEVKNDGNTAVAGGRICLGSYSYIWNTLAAFGDPEDATDNDSHLTHYESNPNKIVQLVKVPDPSKIYCAKQTSGALTYQTIRNADTDVAQELLAQGDHSLSITHLSLTPSTRDDATREALYTFNYTPGTGSLTAMNLDQSACLDASQAKSDLAYCNVVQFSLVVRAGSGV